MRSDGAGHSDPCPPETVAYFVGHINARRREALTRPGTVVLIGGGTWQHRTQVLREFHTS